MKAIGFAPGHISGFFEPVYHKEDFSRSGSRGAGINISLGALSEVFIEPSNKQSVDIYLNKKRSTASVSNYAIKYLIGKNKLKVLVKTILQLPMGQGFGMSGAGALSAALAVAQITGQSREEAVKAAHFAEIQYKTGLGDVLASSFGGLEIRKNAGLPPWGFIEHIPCKSDVVICVIGKKINTKNVLTDSKKANTIVEYGKYCTKKLLDKPSVENYFTLSQIFTNKTGLADKKVIDAINAANNHGNASMCMLGNSVYAVGNTPQLCRILCTFGKLYICFIDNYGARILEI